MDALSIPSASGYEFAFSRNFVMTSSTGVGAIVALCFDSCQELLWAGNSLGKVASFYGRDLSPYTSFTLPLNSAARALEVVGEAVVTLVKDGLSVFKRQGVMLYEFTNNNFEDLTCLCSLPVAPNSVVLGGKQKKLVQIDIEAQKEQRLVFLNDADCLLTRANDRYLYNTDSSGKLTIRSMDSMEAVTTVSAHGDGIYDFDVCGNKIITCGYTTKAGSSFSDPFLKVYDSRNLKALLPLSLHYPPVLCRFANSFSDGRVIIATKYGQALSADLNGHQTNILYQSCDQALPTAMHVSSTRQFAATGDNNGCISLFVDRENASFNTDSWPTLFPSVEDCLPPLPIDNFNSNLACIPTPLPPQNGYCSDEWLENSIRKQFRKPKPINPELLQSTRSAHSVLYAKNPNANTPLGGLNICPYEPSDEDEQQKLMEEQSKTEAQVSAVKTN